jgi:hypothetical protein
VKRFSHFLRFKHFRLIYVIAFRSWEFISPTFRIRRWKVRIFDGLENAKEGFIPADVLDTQHSEQSIFGDKADDAAYRRE